MGNVFRIVGGAMLVLPFLFAGCGNNAPLPKTSVSPSPSLSLLETPDETAVELPPKNPNQEIPKVETPEPAQTVKSSL